MSFPALYAFQVDLSMRISTLLRADPNQSGSVLVAFGTTAKHPLGRWMVEYGAELEVVRDAAGALDVFATLSTAASTEADRETTTKIDSSSGVLCWGR
jgi:hypothetical protein